MKGSQNRVIEGISPRHAGPHRAVPGEEQAWTLRVQFPLCYDVDLPHEKRLQVQNQPCGEPGGSRAWCIDQEIDVRVRIIVAAKHGSEDANIRGTVGAHHYSMAPGRGD